MFRVLCLTLLIATGTSRAATTVVEQPTPAVSTAGELVADVGIETLGGVFTPLIFHGCKLPCSSTKVFSTADDRQLEIKLHLYRGKAKMANHAHPLGTYIVSGFSAARRGTPKVAVTFLVDRSHITIAAIDKQTNRALAIRRSEF